MPGLKDTLADAGSGLGWPVVCRLPQSWAHNAFRFFVGLASRTLLGLPNGGGQLAGG
jgi:hypothetical protein